VTARKPLSPPRLDAIRGDAIYPAQVLRAKLGWEKKTWLHAKREGLPVVQFGRQAYVAGGDVLRFFQGLAERQAAARGPGAQEAHNP
jgi:hypothetical protein